jgi:hypothetical protein
MAINRYMLKRFQNGRRCYSLMPFIIIIIILHIDRAITSYMRVVTRINIYN